MSPNDREALIRAAMLGIAAELASLENDKSGSVTVHFQNTIPLKLEWKFTARPLTFARSGVGVDSREQEE